jgi:hypothetical protein
LTLDSKTIYIASTTYLRQVQWEKQQGEEWTYIGMGQDFNQTKVSELIDSTFTADEIYLVTDRHHSCKCSLAEATKTVMQRLEERGYLLWSLCFDVVLELAPIGVARKGKRTQKLF